MNDQLDESQIESIRKAVEFVSEGQYAPALDAFLEIWRVDFNPTIADIIERIGKTVADRLPPTNELSADDAERLFTERKPTQLDHALAQLTAGTIRQAHQRMLHLLDWPADPRIDRHIARLLHDLPYQSTGSKKFWNVVFQRAAQIQDRSVLKRLDDLDQLYANSVASTMGGWLRGKVVGLRAKLRDLPTIPPNKDFKPWLAKASDLIPAKRKDKSPSGSALLEAVLADPSNDDARLVYADWLQEQGDLRGEFIALQFERLAGKASRESMRRERQLFADHWRQWLGPLASLVLKRDLAFERGFLSRCAAMDNAIRAKEVVGDPSWATVTHFEGPREIYSHPVMRSLDSLVMPWNEDLAELCHHETPWNLTQLDCFCHNNAEAEALADPAALPRLRHLRLRAVSHSRCHIVLSGPLSAQLTRVCVYPPGTTIPVSRWQNWLNTKRMHFESFQMDSQLRGGDGVQLTLKPDDEGRFSKVIVHFKGYGDRPILDALRGLSSKAVSSLEFVWKGRKPAHHEEILQVAKRFRGRAEVILPS